jgi:hypothetical protein
VQSPTEGSCRDCPRLTADPTTLTQVSCSGAPPNAKAARQTNTALTAAVFDLPLVAGPRGNDVTQHIVPLSEKQQKQTRPFASYETLRNTGTRLEACL